MVNPAGGTGQESPGAGDALFVACRLVCRVLAAGMFRLRVRHRRRVPPGPVLFAVNHQSYLDPILVGVSLDRVIHFMARRTLFIGPFGWLIRRINAFPVDRGQADLRAMRQAIDLLRSGRSLVVFPEGTRTRDGRLGRIRPGAALFARKAGVPIVPVYIEGAFRAWPKGQWLPLPARIRVWYGEPMAVAPDADEGEMAGRIESRLAALAAEARDFRRRVGER